MDFNLKFWILTSKSSTISDSTHLQKIYSTKKFQNNQNKPEKKIQQKNENKRRQVDGHGAMRDTRESSVFIRKIK